MRIWESGASREPLVLLRHTGYPVRVAYGPDGHQVAVAGVDGVIRLWDLAGNAHEPPATPVVFSANGRQRVLIHERHLELQSSAGRPNRNRCPPMDRPVAWAILNPDGQCLLAASRVPDGSTTNLEARLWSTSNGQARGPEFRLTGGYTVGVLNSDGSRFVAATDDDAEVWDTTNGSCLMNGSGPRSGRQRRILRPSSVARLRSTWDLP